jgi:hypothetical protein
MLPGLAGGEQADDAASPAMCVLASCGGVELVSAQDAQGASDDESWTIIDQLSEDLPNSPPTRPASTPSNGLPNIEPDDASDLGLWTVVDPFADQELVTPLSDARAPRDD